MSILKKISIFTMLLAMSILLLAPVSAEAATVGQALTNPEDGWQRIDDTDSKIQYNGTWKVSTVEGFWGGTDKYSDTVGNTVSFKFYGTKLRIIGQYNPNASKDTQISIDGITDTYTEYSANAGSRDCLRYLVYENTSMDIGIHTVVITTPSTYPVRFDAIDIDSDGYLIDPNAPQNLIATSGSSQISLSWNSVEGALSYNIKRSTTPGGPYDTIASGPAITFTDRDVAPGTIYYYVVSAIVSGTESSDSNEASATPTEETTDPGHEGNYSTLILTMTNGDDKEYNLSIEDLDDFITWYESNSSGNEYAYYVFTKADNIAPYVSIKEYVSLDKISSFEVKEYNE